MVSEIQSGQTFSCRPPAHLVTMGENNTPTALTGCGVKIEIFPFSIGHPCITLWVDQKFSQNHSTSYVSQIFTFLLFAKIEDGRPFAEVTLVSQI